MPTEKPCKPLRVLNVVLREAELHPVMAKVLDEMLRGQYTCCISDKELLRYVLSAGIRATLNEEDYTRLWSAARIYTRVELGR